LAVTAVAAFHFAPRVLPGGFLGVDIFFVLSGYLITRILATEYLRFGSLRFGNFYLRRARRLLPALGVLLVAALAASAFWRDQLTTVRAGAAAAAGYVSNWWLSFAHQSYFVSAGRPSALQHLWSLAVEEQFYLIWPLITVGVLAVAPRKLKAPALAGFAALLAIGSAVEMAVLATSSHATSGADGSRLYYGTDTHSMGLLLGAALGALAAGVTAGGHEPSRRGRLLWLTDGLAAGAIVTLWIVVVAVSDSAAGLYRGGFLIVAALAATATACVARTGSLVGRILDRAPLRWLAARSYAIYLWHWPVAVVTRPGIDVHWPAFVVLTVRVGVTLLLADATHRLVELPIRTRGLRESVRSGLGRLTRVVAGDAPVGARLATAALLALVLIAGGVLVEGPRASLSPVQQALAAEHGGRDLPLGTPSRNGAGPLAPNQTSGPSSTTAKPQPPARPHSSPVANTGTLPAISAYGDSVMLGAREALDRCFPRGSLDAVEGRQPGPILQDVERDAAAGRLNPLVIIGIGDNGLIDGSQLTQTLVTLQQVKQVIVINNRVGRAWEQPNNETITRIAPRFANVTVVDWHTLSAGHPTWFYDDGIHLTPPGAQAYTALIAHTALVAPTAPSGHTPLSGHTAFSGHRVHAS
jgi:peptidoglycan/LPS O-acetylase OafA/YrhL